MENILLIINDVVLFGGLFAESIFDIFTKKIPIWIMCVMAGCGVIIETVYIIASNPDNRLDFMISRIIAAAIGLALLLISKITHEAMGYGDSMMFLVIGLVEGVNTLLSVLLASVTMAGLVGMIILLILKKDRKYEISFIPFICLSYILMRLIG